MTLIPTHVESQYPPSHGRSDDEFDQGLTSANGKGVSGTDSFPLPQESRRLQVLQRHGILDTLPEARFDRITRLAANSLDFPMAMITLVADERQWYKSCYGLDAVEHHRDGSLCAHAILQQGVTVVQDASADDRFRDHPLVADEPQIRFYAGAPVFSEEGIALGTLCVMDTVARTFASEDQQTLTDCAAIVADVMKLRRESHERKQQAAAIFQIDLGVVVNDPSLPDSPIVFTNPRFCEMTGYQPTDFLGLNCRFLQGPETNQETVDEIRAAIAARRTFRGELLNYRKDGTPFWNELIVSPVFDEAGELISFIGIQSDVTERRRAADELRETIVKLKEAESMRDSLTEMIVHDLRSPLTSIIGCLDLLNALAASRLEPNEAQFIEHARRSSSTIAEMITSLLDVSRLESGQMAVDLQPTDLHQIVTVATEPFQSVIGTRMLKCDLPANPSPVLCDPTLVQRVVANLVSNAVKFTPADGEIRISAAIEDQCARISVTDTGVGIPEEFHVRIFEKFGQVDGRQHLHSTGLGLTFCKLAIEAQGGDIGLQSRVGSGTTLWFTLNLAKQI